MIVTDLSVPLLLEEVDNFGVLEILWNFSLSSHLLEQGGEVRCDLAATIFIDLRWDPVGPGYPPAGELLHSLDGFLRGGWEVEVSIGFNLRQPVNGSLRGGRGPVE
ncbi:unnamed protein product [Dibothriocephalus latus]|uniref:Uncharacterized protein n=1 Tax=Dibothriocephalus latus TaxID=60516 RepID=A0A3P6SI07_DIBLA|nr:unnamed protein product [Dibothriocephalus latus]